MAETWEMLLRHQQERSRSTTIALADRFRNFIASIRRIAPNLAKLLELLRTGDRKKQLRKTWGLLLPPNC
jgi:hypothetical protein